MVRKPPDILITTPESLHLMLTSRAREILRGVSHVIVDEIHAVCGNKRGVFLALLLSGWRRSPGVLRPDRPVGHPAPARRGGPLPGRTRRRRGPGRAAFEPRPVTIIDAGWRKTWTWASSGRARSGPLPRPARHDLAGDRGADRGPGRWPPLDDHLHQQPADGREADRPAQRGRCGRRADRDRGRDRRPTPRPVPPGSGPITAA